MTVETYLILAILLVFFNAFFVTAEFAIVKVRATRIEERFRAGVRRAAATQEILRNLDAYLSVTQLGITLASLGLGWVGEPAFASLISPMFAALGVWSAPVVHSISATLAFAVITFLHIVLGELAPKYLAIQRPESGRALRVGAR